MALPVETFEIEVQTPTAGAQEPGTLRKAAPALFGASCLAALALFQNGSSSLAASPQGSQQLVAAGSPHGGAGELAAVLHINGARPSDVNGVIMDAPEFAPHMVGGRRDAHGCNPSSGYVWCASRGECLQPFRHHCADLSASVQEIAQEVSSWDADSSGGRFGGRRDEHGCMGSGGFIWCASAGECVQPWVTPCASLQEPLQRAIQEGLLEPAQAAEPPTAGPAELTTPFPTAGPTDSPAEPTDRPAPTDSSAESTTPGPAGCVPVVLPHTGTLSEEERTVDELNALFLAFDESDPTSGNGVTIRMTDDFQMWCGTGCNNGYADCRVSASVYNHRVMIRHDTNNIAVTMGRDAGIIFNQAAVETTFGKCSYMYDGATFARVNRGCGCASKTNFCGNHASAWNNEDCVWETPREWNNPVEGSCHTNTATSPDVAECACSAPSPREPMPQRTTDNQCFWQGAAINGTTGTVPSELRQMLLQRIENQVGTEDVGEPTIRYKQEYWNEIVLDAEVLIDALNADPRSAVAAFVYIRGHGPGRAKANRMSQKAAQDYGGSPIPVIELNPWVDGACNGPFRVPDEDITSIAV